MDKNLKEICKTYDGNGDVNSVTYRDTNGKLIIFGDEAAARMNRLLDENAALRNRILRLRLTLLDLSEHRWECKTRQMAIAALIRDENNGYCPNAGTERRREQLKEIENEKD